MAKESAGAPDSGEAKPNPEETQGTPGNSPDPPEGETARQGELPLGDARDDPADPGDTEKADPQDQHEPGEEQGHEEDHADEYSDDHYGYHDNQYHEEYHDFHHDDPHHDEPHVYAGGGHDGGDPGEPDDDDEDLDDNGQPYGGPIKPFLDHLEDFRWMLLKIFATLAVGMVITLVASPNIMGLLTKPMEWARDSKYLKMDDYLTLSPKKAEDRFVPVRLGDKQISTIKGASLENLYPDANKTYRNSIQEVELKLTNLPPVNGVTNQVLTLGVKIEGPRMAAIPEAKYYGVIDPFLGAIKLAIYGGIFISIPFILYFIGDFVLPALKHKERKLIYYIVGGGTFLFIAGAAFCYFILLQLTMVISVSFAHMLGFGADEWRADDLIGFVAKFTIGMGLAFQIPMVILSLVKVGFVDDRGLSKFRSYALIINLILAAMITPTVDPFTMLMVAGPLQFLYEISLFIARIWRKRDEAAERAEEEADKRENEEAKKRAEEEADDE